MRFKDYINIIDERVNQPLFRKYEKTVVFNEYCLKKLI